jgi:hypothetical protein
MSALKGGPTAGAPPPKPTDPGPAPGPMLTPQKAGGHTASAKAAVMVCRKLFEQVLPLFGSQTDEGKAVLKCLKEIGGAFGEEESKTNELMPAEIQQLLAGLAGPGAPAPGMPGPPKPPGAGAPPGAAPGAPPGAMPPGAPPPM